MWPFLGEFVDSVLKKDVEPQVRKLITLKLVKISIKIQLEKTTKVREVLDAKGLGGFRFRQIHFGKIAPKVVAIKVGLFAKTFFEQSQLMCK